jgi:hypothetical protein
MIVFSDFALCSLVETEWRFRGAYRLHHQAMHLWNFGEILPEFKELTLHSVTFILIAMITWNITIKRHLKPWYLCFIFYVGVSLFSSTLTENCPLVSVTGEVSPLPSVV